MKKLIIQQEVIPHYRVPVFNAIAEKYDLTVTYSKGNLPPDIRFKTLRLTPKKIPKIGTLLGAEFVRAVREADAVICPLPTSCIELNYLRIWNRSVKLIGWGIGVPASYQTRYDDPAVPVQNMLKRMKKMQALLFYSDYPKRKYTGLGIPSEKMFVANNTVEIDETVVPAAEEERTTLLFVGSLYRQKKIEILLESYLTAFQAVRELPDLIIIGDGDQKENYEKWIEDHQLQKKIHLIGAVYDEELLAAYFRQAILCISPDQAGLSVLKSMGYGVPYVTHRNAITGGEIFNIHNGKDGILMESFEELPQILESCGQRKNEYRAMGEAARKFYLEQRTVGQMAQGFFDAVEYVLGL